MRRRVERPTVHASRRTAHQAHGPFQHFLRGAPGEREQENPVRPNAAGHEMRHAVHERARFAGAGTGDDQERAVTMLGGSQLRSVQRLWTGRERH